MGNIQIFKPTNKQKNRKLKVEKIVILNLNEKKKKLLINSIVSINIVRINKRNV